MSEPLHVFEELLDRYRVGLLEHHADIAQALFVDDIERACGVAHMLKGTAGSYGLTSVGEQARRCESGFLDGIDRGELRELFVELMTRIMEEVPPPSAYGRQ